MGVSPVPQASDAARPLSEAPAHHRARGTRRQPPTRRSRHETRSPRRPEQPS